MGGDGIYLYRSDDGNFAYQYEKSAQLSQLTVNGTIKIEDFKPEHYAQIALPDALLMEALHLHLEDNIALRVEREGADRRPVARVARPAARVAFSGLAIQGMTPL